MAHWLLPCVLSLGLLACSHPKGSTSFRVTPAPTKRVASAPLHQDTLSLEVVSQQHLSPDTTLLRYRIVNRTTRRYTYLTDEYWVEQHQSGRWTRLPNDFGSVLMPTAIPARSHIEGRIWLHLPQGHYRLCHTLYADAGTATSDTIVLKAAFVIR